MAEILDRDGNRMFGASIPVTNTAAANTQVVLTIPAGAAGLFAYITGIHIGRTATAALAGTATIVITSTNIPGAWAHSVGNAMTAGGTQTDVALAYGTPIKTSAAATATTITFPAPGAAVLARITVYYYYAP